MHDASSPKLIQIIQIILKIDMYHNNFKSGHVINYRLGNVKRGNRVFYENMETQTIY